eukprot:scaffold468008_cov45-Prasinocladus_malaysianus.AAC.1
MAPLSERFCHLLLPDTQRAAPGPLWRPFTRTAPLHLLQMPRPRPSRCWGWMSSRWRPWLMSLTTCGECAKLALVAITSTIVVVTLPDR